ncbi:FAD-binding oxidoreductase [Mesorhizobium sp. LNHC252B00]|uniref:NAD(P)/FAD-dependent oxidoreductase n=1 Tax=Mesorhizobium sp. LNHC252B00 TaxID=1287252 RepID=UPI0009FFCC02|nr:FAD-binding oxidoreductase [Mesorhizobium sp. LNHC252B00]
MNSFAAPPQRTIDPASSRHQSWRMRPWTMAGRSGRASFWVDQALGEEPNAERDARILEGDLKVDVCIVGGGFTGLWTAIRLLEHDPSLEVAVVEAELSGTGASGRNGGVMSDWWMEVDTLRKHFGVEGAKQLAGAVGTAADDIQSFCKQEGIEANIARAGWFWTATNQAQIASMEHMIEATQSLGMDIYERVGADELAARLGSSIHRMGLRDPSGGSLHPARLARGLRRSAIKRGVKVFERSPVLEIKAGSNVRVHCERGVVQADQVVMAANAWMAHLPDFRRDTFICSSDLVATAPMPEVFSELGWTGQEVNFDAKAMLFYWRGTADKRVIYGNVGRKLGLGPKIEDRWERPSDEILREIERGRQRTLPRLDKVKKTHAWQGPIDRSSTGLPRIGKLGGDPRITFVIGFSGTGVLPTSTLGRCLASLVLNRDDSWAHHARLLQHTGSYFPPEPIRYFGGRLIQRAIIKKEAAEDLGRKPSPVVRAFVKSFMPDGTHIAPPTLSSLRKVFASGSQT